MQGRNLRTQESSGENAEWGGRELAYGVIVIASKRRWARTRKL